MNPRFHKTILWALILFAITFVSRVFFLHDGYGVEEDSWGLVVNAYSMKAAGHYTVSRFPGHPVQEYVYRLIYDQPAFVYNLISAIFSAIGSILFFLVLQKLNVRGAVAGAVALAFTPVVYIAGVCTIDYAWTLAFVLGAFLLLLNKKYFWAGCCLGMAIGCRITSGIFLLPFLFLIIDHKNWRAGVRPLLWFIVPAGLLGILCYVPVYLQYGTAFFDYSDQFPYPPLAKILYKASIGVFGLIGLTAVGVGFGLGIWNRVKKINPVADADAARTKKMLTISVIVIVLHIISYLRLPQKSAYLMPIVPFVILFMAMTLKQRMFNVLAALLVLSPFVCSINLTDPLRGSESSAASIKFHIAGQEVFFDPFSGPIFSERSKRLNKLAYCENILQRTDTLSQKTIIISGWWYNELLTEHLHGRKQNPNVGYRFYCTEQEMRDSISQGWRITYLPEQDVYNDQMFGQSCTNKLATPFAP